MSIVLHMINKHAFSRRRLIAALAVAASPTGSLSAFETKRTERRHPPYIDGLSFLPADLSDIPASGLSGMICDVSEVEEVKDDQGFPRYLRTPSANERALAAATARIDSSDLVYVARKGSDLGNKPGCAAYLQFQSCETLGNDIGRVESFKAMGLSVLQLTHHNNNAVAGGAIEPVQTGLTPFGREVIREMNRNRVVPDVSHGSAATIFEAATLSRSPILYSHGACKTLVDHPRCIDDDGIRTIAKRGGVVGIFMMSFWLTRDAVPRLDHWIAHIRHAAKIGGIECVGVANDFPMAGQENLLKLGNDNAEGVKEYLTWWKAMHARGVPGFSELPRHVVIPTLNHIDRLDRIYDALGKAGFKAKDADRVMGRNWKRILTDVLG